MDPMSTPRASSLSCKPNVDLDKNGQGSHLLPYDINGRKCELDETNTSTVKDFFKSYGGPFVRLTSLPKYLIAFKSTHYKKLIPLPYVYYVR